MSPPPVSDEHLQDEFRTVLASVDRRGRRRWLYVDLPQGFWRRLRRVVTTFLIAVYLATPFISIGGRPLLRFDIPNRQAFIFGQVFIPQDMPYLLLLVLLAVIGTVALVSLFGRVFCGWLCPHNIFLEFVYRPVEALLEGRAHRRRHQDKHPTGDLVARKIVKYLLFVLISGILANTATALFVDKDAFLFGVLINPVEHASAAWFFAIFFSACMFNFLWFREQTCTLVCPYGRLQSAMLDSDSLVVGYDPQRGEPRGRRKQGQDHSALGDCIDCYRCVQVCPTGIDIRNGIQLECINCTACIDACDDVMRRIHKPLGLIRYTSENELAGGRRRLWRPRTMLYTAVLLILLSTASVLILRRPPIDVVLMRFSTPQLLVVDAEGGNRVRRLAKVMVLNRSAEMRPIRVQLAEGSGASLITRETELQLSPGGQSELAIFIEMPTALFGAYRQEVDLQIISHDYRTSLSIPLTKPR